MSEELLGVIITSGVTSIISVIGFIVTKEILRKNWKKKKRVFILKKCHLYHMKY